MQLAAPHAHSTTGSPPPRDPPEKDELAAAIARLRAELDGIFGAVRRAAYVERQVIGLSLFDLALRAGIFLGLGVGGVTLAATACLLAVSGARRGLASLAQGAWWSDLALAFLIVGLLAVCTIAFRRFVHRSTLARTLKRLASDRPSAAAGEGVE